MRLRKLLALLLCAGMIAVVFSGCVSPEDLFQPPRPAVIFEDLQAQIDSLLSGGQQRSAPTSGEYRQSIQLYDLTGDGIEEAVIFLKNSSEKQQTIIVYTVEGEKYYPLPPIVEAAESIHSVNYRDFDGDGNMEIVVGWKLESMLSVSVYTLSDNALVETLSRPYSGYLIHDMEKQYPAALVVINIDPQKDGVVEMYQAKDGEMALTGSARLSQEVESVVRMRAGKLSDGFPGIYITSKYQTNSEITDVIAYRGDSLVNVSTNMETAISDSLIVHNGMTFTDINADGVIDLPRPVVLPAHPEDPAADPYYDVRWYSYDSNGGSVMVSHTYHSLRNNWYLVLPDWWPERYTVRRGISTGPTLTIFSAWDEDMDPVDILSVYTVTRTAGDTSMINSRTVLYERTTLLVLGEIHTMPAHYARYQLNEDMLRQSFNMIQTDWRVYS